MKAILVIDMPNECRDCVCASKFYEKYECNFINDGTLTDGRCRRYDCPLKPIPTKEEIYERIRQEVEDIYDEALGVEE